MRARALALLAALYVVAMVALVAFATAPARPETPPSDSVSVPADSFYHMTPEQLRGVCETCERPWQT